jgi:hypothetical protein
MGCNALCHEKEIVKAGWSWLFSLGDAVFKRTQLKLRGINFL